MRVAVFIDGAYLNKLIRTHHGGVRLAYDRLASELAGGSDLLRTYYYDSPPYQSNPPTKDESERFAARQQFFNSLSKLPRFEVRQGRCGRIWDRERNDWKYVQKRVDVLLSVDLVRLASKSQIQRAVLIAGDSDFLPAVATAKDDGVQIHVYHSPNIREIHRELWNAADERTPVDAALVARLRH